MKLYYEVYGKLEYIGDFNTKDDALEEIRQFWYSCGYDIPYFRIIDHPEYYKIDFSSHVQFYRLYKENKSCEKE